MGLFFDDKEEVKKEKPEVTNQHPGFFAVVVIMLLAGLLKLLWTIVEPFLKWVFTIEGRTKEQLRTQVIAGITIFGLLFFLLYRIPFWRDIISLSSSHTINVNNGARVLFPDRSYFAEQGETKILRFEEVGGITYFTYSGYNERIANTLHQNMCQLVPRTEKILLSSEYKPKYVVGFEDMVSYSVKKNVNELRGLDTILIYFAHPNFIWKSKEFLSTQEYIFTTETTWREFLYNWENVRPISGTNYKWYRLQAKSNEHAIICI